LTAPILMMGVARPEDSLHGPDESVEVDRLLRGAHAVTYLLETLGGGRDV
jgi:acetylornithine deacetylase/succinyl-diaminopimelate desuccinylase-like protein